MSRQSGGGFYRWATLLVSAIGVLVAVIVATEDGQIPAFARKAASWIGWATDAAPPTPVDPAKAPVAPMPETSPTAPDPQPEQDRSGAMTQIRVMAHDSGNFCGIDYVVTFRKRGSGLGDAVYLRRGDKRLRLGQHEPQEIDPGCPVTFLGFEESSNDYARFSVPE